MKLRRSAPAILIVVALFVVATTAVMSNRLFAGMTSAVEEDQYALMESIVTSALRSAEGRAHARAAMLADSPTNRRLLAARNRAGLLAENAEVFRIQREQYGVDQIQFHVPPATSFLRLHSPDLHSDDLTRFRPLVVAVNASKSPRRGVAVARGGPAVFGVVPVRSPEGQHTGSVEVGIELGAVLDDLKASYQLELTAYIDEDTLRRYATGARGDVLSSQNRVGRYLKFHSTHWSLMRQLVGADDLGNIDEPTRHDRVAGSVPYGIVLVPLRSGSGAHLGMIAVARDFSGTRAATMRSVVWQALLGLFGLVILAGAVLVVLRGMLLRPLRVIGDGFGDLAAGRPTAAVDDPDALCEELQSLARHHETLRARAASTAGSPDPQAR